MKKIMLCALLLVACHKDEESKQPDESFAGAMPAPEDLAAQAPQTQALQERMLTGYVEDGFPVTRKGDELRDLGEGAEFAGLAVGTLDCEHGAPMFAALVADITEHGGRIHRHPALEDVDTSRDALIGVMFGLVQRWNHCPGDRELIAQTWALHVSYVEGLGGGRLYPGAGEDKQINGGLFWLWDKVGNYFGVRSDAPRATKGRFEADLLGTVAGIVVAKQACYPLNLNLINQYTSLALGSPVANRTRFLWCAATRGTGVPMIEWYCEREPALSYLATYEPVWSFRHQRCKWEDEDHEKQGSGLDYLLLEGLASRRIL